MLTSSPLLVRLAYEACHYADASVVSCLPCESYGSGHWHRLARCYPFDLFARTEPDDAAESGQDCVGLRVQLRNAGDTIREVSLWGIECPDCAADWTFFNANLCDTLHTLIREACDTERVRIMLRERLATAEHLLEATYAVPEV